MKTLASDLLSNLAPELPEKKESFSYRTGILEHMINSFKEYAMRINIKDEYLEPPLIRLPSATNAEIQQFYELVAQQKIVQDIRGHIVPYLNTLFNNSCEKELTFTPLSDRDTHNIGECFGSGTAQKLTINGDVGMWTGQNMSRGLIHVRGDAGNDTGKYMKGGALVVSGHITSIGTFSKGTIVCRGTCEKVPLNVGTVYARCIGKIEGKWNEFIAKEGRIYNRYEIDDIPPACKATIYVANKKYWADGKKV